MKYPAFMRTVAAFGLLAATLLPSSAQTIRRVTTAGDASANGSSWMNAMTLQAALRASTRAGDQVWIAAGIYLPHPSDRNATFRIRAGVLVYGGFDPVADATDTDTSSRSGGATILSGDLADNDIVRPAEGDDQTVYDASRTDNSYTMVTLTGANVTLDGLTIEAGERGTEFMNLSLGITFYYGTGLYEEAGTTGTTLTNCTFNNNSAGDSGGGAYFRGTATLTGCTFNNNHSGYWGGGASFVEGATLTDCTFTKNTASGGLSSGGGAHFLTTGTLTRCTFTDNEAFREGGGAYFWDAGSTLTNCTFNNNSVHEAGGGVGFLNAATLTNCTFNNNHADEGGGGGCFYGQTTLTGCDFNSNDSGYSGGGATFSSVATVTNCTFTDNEAISDGGGATFSGVATVTNCTFTGNETTSNNGGGAAFSQAGTLVNCVFANNSATPDGGGVYFSSRGTVTNTTFYNNTATQKGGGIYAGNSTFTLRNSLLIDNTAVNDAAGHQVYAENLNANNTVNINYNLIEGGANGVAFEDELGQAVVEITLMREATDGGTLFMSTTVEDDDFLRLADNTVALNAGNNDYVNMATPPITHDAAGNARIQGVVGNKLVDLGAYESAYETILQVPQTIDFTLDAEGVIGIALDLGTTSSGLAITYTISNTDVAEVGTGDQAGKLILKAIGTATITASQAGNTGFMAATAVTQTIRVREPIVRRVTMTGTGDGSNWTQAMTLQAALATTPGDHIWMAAGTYRPGMADDGNPDTDEREATFRIPEGVLIYGGFEGTDVATDDDGFDPVAGTDGRVRETDGAFTNETILSGDLADDDGTRPAPPVAEMPTAEETAALAAYAATREDNSYTVVTLAGKNVRLNGLTIEAGERGAEVITGHHGAGLYAGVGTTVMLTACTFTNNSADDDGGGAYFNAEVTLTTCTFNNNTVSDRYSDGGGAYFFRTATLTGCTFNNNAADDDGGGAYFRTEATLTGCTFTENMTTDSRSDGGGAFFSRTATLTGCTFTDNTASGQNSDGGGAYFDAEATLTGCIFTDNTASSRFFNLGGGGVYFSQAGTLVNCVFANNNGSIDGGGVFFRRGGTVINSTFYNNRAARGGGIFFFTSTNNPVTLQNNLFLGNTSGHQVYVINSRASDVVIIQHNLLAGGATAGIGYWTPGAAGITEANTVDASDPALVFASTDAAHADYLRLKDGSPAMDAGNNDYLDNGTPDDTDDDIKTDAVGEARIQSGTVDLGAYEGESAFVTPTAQTITFISDDTGTVGNTITLAATASSGLPVTFAITTQTPTSGTGNVATLAAGVLSLASAGTVVITATQTGNANYAEATQTQTIAVSVTPPTAQTITFTSDDTGIVGNTITLAATASSGLPVTFAITTQTPTSGTGNVATLAAGVLSLASAGTVVITATQTGDANYAEATQTQTIAVSVTPPTAQTITFTSDDTGTVGNTITLAATASSGLPVTFAITTQTPTSGTGNVATLAAGVLTLENAGTMVITATQTGNANYAEATQTQTIAVSVTPPTAQTITFTSDDTGLVGNTITLMATASSGLPVTFAITTQTPTSGTGNVATLAAGVLTLAGAGTVVITATQTGNANYAEATQTQTIAVAESVLGIEEDAGDFVLYPNPTSGKLHFSERVGQFRLYGVEGRLLEVWENVRSADLTARPAGLYFAEVIRDGRSVRYRIVRE